MQIPLNYPENTPDRDKVVRSESTNRLITPAMVSQGEGVGERVRIATHLTLTEWLLTKIRLLK